MRKKIVVVSFIVLLTLAGFIAFKTINKEATALNDSFTKEFIEEEWVEDDFHLFQSKTGQYRMLFPDQFQMVSDPPEFYGRRGSSYEHWLGLLRDEGINYSFKLTYTNSEANFVKTDLNSMLRNFAYDNQYEELPTENKTIYHGSSRIVLENGKGIIKDPTKNVANSFFGLVSDDQSNQLVEFYYSVDCFNEEHGCEIDAEQEYELALKIMNSIEFLD
ncbi:hypothetical protein AB3N04_06565 [Alkalihalophilus sp. As8PL]|uniref:Uncharacterized protein n=1 Tax=Alkalihalophilus sp. As8PL TaxID=3237103 RepID=A0AB39BVC9_9BACI